MVRDERTAPDDLVGWWVSYGWKIEGLAGHLKQYMTEKGKTKMDELMKSDAGGPDGWDETLLSALLKGSQSTVGGPSGHEPATATDDRRIRRDQNETIYADHG